MRKRRQRRHNWSFPPDKLVNSLSYSKFVGNIATDSVYGAGAGVYVMYGHLRLEDTLMASNTAHMGGGVLVSEESESELVNMVGVHNTADWGDGGVRFHNSTNVMLYCTIADNEVAGVYCTGSAGVSMSNCIVWGHSWREVSSDQSVNCCDIRGGYSTGAGNITNDPAFVNPGALDYQLSDISPCIDTGVCVGIDYDCIGETRPYGDGCDIGAYEWVPEPCLFIIGCLSFITCHLRRRTSFPRCS